MTSYISIVVLLLTALVLSACQNESIPNPLLAKVMIAMNERDPHLGQAVVNVDTNALVANPTSYQISDDALKILLDSREPQVTGDLEPTTQFLLEELSMERVQIYAKANLLANVSAYLPQAMVEGLAKTDQQAATSLGGNREVAFAGQRATRKCIILLEADGAFYNFDDNVTKFNNKLLNSCRDDIATLLELYEKRFDVEQVLGLN